MRYGIVGATGKMGREILEVLGPQDCVARLSLEGEEITGDPLVVFDFSRPQALDRTVRFCLDKKSALVIGTTGLSEEHFKSLRTLSLTVPVVQGYNFSQGTGILRMVLRKFAPLLADWDCGITETHHTQKTDAPSGTALILERELGRQCQTLSLRLGGVPGDHSVVFANQGEVLSFSHRALSRKVFAMGALKAAEFALEKTRGFYDFEEVLTCGLRT